MMVAKQYTVWGYKPDVLPDPYPIRLTGGNLRRCRVESIERSDQGWLTGIYLDGDWPLGLRDQVIAAQPDPDAARVRLSELAADGLGWLVIR